jgi:hypothetical protein
MSKIECQVTFLQVVHTVNFKISEIFWYDNDDDDDDDDMTMNTGTSIYQNQKKQIMKVK